MGGKANVVRKVKTDKEVCRNRQEKPNERQMEMEKFFEEVISGRLVVNEEGEFVRREEEKGEEEMEGD